VNEWVKRALLLTMLWLVGVLVGCAPTIDRPETALDAPLAVVSTADAGPRFTRTAFITTDGQTLPLRRWLPAGRPRAVILALHGFNDYSNAFTGPAENWARAGIATYAYDQRGFGAAPERGLWPGRVELAADATAACGVLRRLYPRVPLYLLGESMGGAVAVVAMTGEAGTAVPDVDGVIMTAPAVWGRATMGLLPRVALWVAVRVAPSLKLTGQSLHIVASDNIPMLRALGRDPLVIKGTRIDVIWGLVNLMDAALDAAPRLRAPLLVMYGEHDPIIPKGPMDRFIRALLHNGHDGVSVAYYRHGYHMLLRDLDGPMVAADVAGWVLSPSAPLRSGADHNSFAAGRGDAAEAALVGE
jgi:acylglycerol lipase